MGGAIISESGGDIIPLRGAASSRNWGAASSGISTLAQLHNDRGRQSIDKALSDALGLPDLAPIRELLSREPGLNAVDINPRVKPDDDDEADDEAA